MDYIPIETTGMISGVLLSFEDGKLETHNSLISNNCDYIDIQNRAEGSIIMVRELKNCGLYEYGDEGAKKYTIMCRIVEPKSSAEAENIEKTGFEAETAAVKKRHPGKISSAISVVSGYFIALKCFIENIVF